MLRLIQIVNHMLVYLEYSETEVQQAFEAIESGELSYDQLLDIINVVPSEAQDERAILKLDKWPSALEFVSNALIINSEVS